MPRLTELPKRLLVGRALRRDPLGEQAPSRERRIVRTGAYPAGVLIGAGLATVVLSYAVIVLIAKHTDGRASSGKVLDLDHR